MTSYHPGCDLPLSVMLAKNGPAANDPVADIEQNPHPELMRLAVSASAVMMLLIQSAASAEDRPCLGFEGGKADPVEANQFYALRAISILTAAVGGDREALDALVAPEAEFRLWRGDYASSARSRGSMGAIEMVRDLRPLSFQSQTAQPGPMQLVLAECTWDVTVLFRSGQPSQGVSVKFDFRDGLLVSATGQEMALLEGSIR